MMTTYTQEKVFVGVDVSKFTLDIFSPDTGKSFRIENSEAAIQKLCLQLKKTIGR